MQNRPLNKDSFRDTIDIYLAKWKYIAIALLIALTAAFIYLRYANYEYKATASIKIREDNEANKLPEISSLQNYGIFAADFSRVEDEIEIIRSRRIIEQMVKDLKLNIKYYVQGRIKEQETYVDPPLALNFFESDSIINMVDTTLYINIKSETQFQMSSKSMKEIIRFNGKGNVSEQDFGNKITTSFGDIVITPNIGAYGTEIGSEIRVKLTPVDVVVEQYIDKVKVQSQPKSGILKLSVNERVKEKGILILDKLIEKYNEDAVYDKEEIVKVTSDFINNRLEVVSRELEQVDLTAESLKKSNRLSDIASQSSIFLQSEKENEAKLIATSNQLQLIDYMTDYMGDKNADSDLLPANVGITDSNIAQITKSHNELVLQRDRLLRNSTEKNPTVVNLNNQIRALKNNLNQSLNNLKESTQITLNTLNAEDARISSQIYATPQKERQFRDITRQQSIKESLYLYLLEKREETAITLGMSSPNAKIIDQAYSTTLPISPRKKIVYLAALLLGILIPIGIIYLLDLMDTKVHTKEDVAKYVKAPFLGDIPKSSSKKKKRLISKVDYSPKAEAFRMARTNLSFMLQNKADDSAKTIFVTSTTAQEGKSHTSINLASSISFSEKRVLLVETDIRVPRVEDYLGIGKNKHGLTDYISDKKISVEDIIVKSKDNEYLDVIPSGTIPPNPAELLMSDRMKDLFKNVKQKYDYVIVDTAAVGLVTDTLLISDHADMFIYVISASKLDKRQLHVAQTMYEESRLPNMCVLLNGTSKRKGYGYGYGYGASAKKKKWYQFG